MKNYYLLIHIMVAHLLAIPICVISQNINQPKSNIVKFDASYTGDNAINIAGGIKQGATYMGMANARLTFDFDNRTFWKGGKVHFHAVNIHSTRSLSELVGDSQVTSNIDAGNHTYIQEMWVKQSFGNFELTAGLQDLNIEFANTASGALYLNSSFGVLPTISANMCAPIFPLTTLGFTVKYNLGKNLNWISAIYDGCPVDFSDNPYNIKWKFNRLDGLLTISEIQYNATINQMRGTYKIGLFSSDQWISKDSDFNLPDSLSRDIHGFYIHTDQTIWKSDTRQLDFFSQLGYSPAKKSTTDFYCGIGFNFNGLFNKNGDDVIGLAVAHEKFNNSIINETVIELTYKYSLTENIFIQPDMQYIINPSGTGETLPNAIVGSLRFGLSF